MKNRLTVIAAAVSLLPAFVFSDEPATGWKQTAEGTYYYTNTANWVGGVVNGVFGSDLTLTGAQTIIFDDDIALTNGLNISYAGNYPMTFQSDGTGAKTLMLEKDVFANISKNGSASHVIFGSEDPLFNIVFNLSGRTAVFEQSATQNDPSKTGWMKIYSVLLNGDVCYSGLGPIKIYGDNTYSGGTTLANTGYIYLNHDNAFGTGPVLIENVASADLKKIPRLHCDSPVEINNAWRILGSFAFHGSKTMVLNGGLIIDNPVTFMCESANLTINSPYINDSNGNCAIANFKKFGGKTLEMNTPLSIEGVITIGDGIWNMRGKISGQNGFTVVGESGKGSYIQFFNDENDFSGLVTVSSDTAYAGIKFAEENSLPDNVIIKCIGNGVIASCSSKGYSLKALIEKKCIDTSSTGILAFGETEDDDINLSDYPDIAIGASGNYTYNGVISSSKRICVESPGNLTVTAPNAFSTDDDVIISGSQVIIKSLQDFTRSVTVESGKLTLSGREGSFPNATINVVQGATLSLESSETCDVLRANKVILQSGTLYFSGHKNYFVMHRVPRLVLNTQPGKGGTPLLSWSTKDSKQTTLKIGEIERINLCPLNVSGGDPGTSNFESGWNIVVDNGVENTELGVVGTVTSPFVPWIRKGLKTLVYNDPLRGLRFHTDDERTVYNEAYNEIGPRVEGENMVVNYSGNIVFTGEVSTVATFCFGDKENQYLIATNGILRVTSGSFGSTFNKTYPKANIDLCNKVGYIFYAYNRAPRLQGNIGGTDKGLVIANDSTGSGNSLEINATGTYSGDVYIYGKIWNQSSTFLPAGEDRPGNVYVEGAWILGNANPTVNAIFGGGSIELNNNYTTTITLGADGHDGNFTGQVIRTKDTLTLKKIGTGCQRFGGECTHNGNTTIEQGTLQFDGSVTRSNITVKEGACLAGVGSIALDAKLENNTVLYPGSAYLADDKILDFASKLTFGESATLRLKVYSKSSVSSVDVAGAFSAAGDVTVELDKDTFRGEACILNSSEPLQANFVRGLNCGHLQLRNDDTELWLLGDTSFSIIVR